MQRLVRAAKMTVMNSVAPRFVVPHLTRAKVYRWCGVQIGRWSYVYPHQTIRPGPLVIGDGCVLNYGGTLDPGDAGITIENDVFIGVNAVIIAQTHAIGPTGKRAGSLTSTPVVIGRGSWLGARVTVLPGVRIAPGCVVGAGSVVTRDTEPDGVYVGSPARRVRDLPRDAPQRSVVLPDTGRGQVLPAESHVAR